MICFMCGREIICRIIRMVFLCVDAFYFVKSIKQPIFRLSDWQRYHLPEANIGDSE